MGLCGSNNSNDRHTYGNNGHFDNNPSLTQSPLMLHNGSVLSLVLRDGTLVAASDDKSISVSDLVSLRQDTKQFHGSYLKGHTRAVNRVAFSADGHLWSASRDLSLRKVCFLPC
jgi:hypothetical protein